MERRRVDVRGKREESQQSSTSNSRVRCTSPTNYSLPSLPHLISLLCSAFTPVVLCCCSLPCNRLANQTVRPDRRQDSGAAKNESLNTPTWQLTGTLAVRRLAP
ncbi:uncharacterized protein BO97DRAFT_127769 [Aspergillus homomorphus CBS 101889]|uniref:Uncharacterized protein n=1 Tax=Aspergillus homomorphus (strain CBS 101889) TaxID=1450537 RepID=A0A395HSM9_ASPHC|nr:hypothetical protein BO97DRAFT_127769 [Aspergillus homomorphus CBS 101889]RAL10499.1 hypothetical protein BO97DRAFT_127769 [Aspergillus homomorphus CBS 101889]